MTIVLTPRLWLCVSADTCSNNTYIFTLLYTSAITWNKFYHIQDVPGGKVNIVGGHSICHFKQKCLCEHVFYSERFLR